MMSQDIALNGRVAIITGAASGLGAAAARAFGEAGCAIVGLDVNADALNALGHDLTARDTESLTIPCDVRDADAVSRAVEETLQRFGRLDIVVNNAAIDHTLAVSEMTVEQWDQVIAVNLRAPFLLARAALPAMQRQRYGHIFNVASTAATRAWANASAYHASKWGLIGFSRGLGVEGRPYGIRVTTIIPGGMRTHFFDRFVDQGIPMPDEANLQDPANVARAMVFAAQMPLESAVQEIMITPLTETSWP